MQRGDNCTLLFHPTIHVSITDEEEVKELGDSTIITIPQQAMHKIIDLTNDAPNINPQYINSPYPNPTNPTVATTTFTSGIAAWYLDTIVKDRDLNAAHTRIKKNQTQGKSHKTKTQESENITANRLFKALRSCCIGQTIYDNQKEKIEED